MTILPYQELERNSDTALFFGCGPSINDITEDDYEVLKQYDKWAVNFFLLHDFIIPDYYFRSLRKRDKNFPLFRKLWNEKEEYKDVAFLTDTSKLTVYEINANKKYLLKFYRSWKKAWIRRQRAHPDPVKHEYDVHKIALDNFEIMDDMIYFYGRASTCALLVLMYQMGYKEIVIYGNDLNTKTYFWSDRPKNEIHWEWAKQGKSGKDGMKKGNHPNIISMTTFVPWFSENYMNNRIFIGSKRTLLYDDVPYKSIEELR